MAKHKTSTIWQNKYGPYRISVHQYSYLKRKLTRILKISITLRDLGSKKHRNKCDISIF